jgi:zinc protease
VLLAALSVGGCAPPARLVTPLSYAVVARATPDAPFRASAPPKSPVAERVDPPPRETTLPNGLKVLLFERHGYPTVALRLIVDRGAVDIGDPGGLRVEQANYLYGRGGSEASFEAESAELTGAARLGSTTGVDWLSWSASVPADELDKAFRILARRSFGARLEREEYERRAAEWVAYAKRGSTGLVLGERSILFGKDHAYGYAGPGTEMIRYEDAERLRASLVRPDCATLVVVGDVTPARLDEAVTKWLGAVARPPTPLASAPQSPAPIPGPRVAVLSNRGLTQRQATVFARGPASGDDVYALVVTAKLLGGAGNPLWSETRETMGATYGIAATVARNRMASWLAVRGGFESDKAVAGVRAILDAVARLRAGDVTDEAITDARESILAEWRAGMSTCQSAAGIYAAGVGFGELDALRDLPARVARIGRQEIVKAAERYLAARHLHVLFVGEDRWLNVSPLEMGGAADLVLPE